MINNPLIDKTEIKITQAKDKKPFAFSRVVKEDLEELYEVAYAHGQADERQKIRDVLGL